MFVGQVFSNLALNRWLTCPALDMCPAQPKRSVSIDGGIKKMVGL